MLEFTPVKIYFWSADYFEILKVYTTYNEEQIEIFELEKSVCDAVPCRNKVGAELTIEVLRNYLKRSDRNLDKIMKYAEGVRIAIVLKQYLTMKL